MSESSASSLRAISGGLAPFLLVSAALAWSVLPTPAQEAPDSLTGETSAALAKKHEIAPGYNLYWGPVSFQLESALQVEFTDSPVMHHLPRRACLTRILLEH